MEAVTSIDEEVVLWLNQWAGRSQVLDETVELLVGDHFIPVLISLCLLAMWFVGRDLQSRESHQRAVLISIISMGFASLAVLILDQYFFRDRPFVDHEITLLFYQPTDSSFPAHPAAVGFAMAAGMWQANRRMGAFLFGLAALWGLSRIFSGVFYPSDVVAGGAIGVGVSYLVAVGFRLIEPLPTMVLRVTRTLHLA